MQLIVIVLLLLVGLRGSEDIIGKKRAWLAAHGRATLSYLKIKRLGKIDKRSVQKVLDILHEIFAP